MVEKEKFKKAVLIKSIPKKGPNDVKAKEAAKQFLSRLLAEFAVEESDSVINIFVDSSSLQD